MPKKEFTIPLNVLLVLLTNEGFFMQLLEALKEFHINTPDLIPFATFNNAGPLTSLSTWASFSYSLRWCPLIYGDYFVVPLKQLLKGEISGFTLISAGNTERSDKSGPPSDERKVRTGLKLPNEKEVHAALKLLSFLMMVPKDNDDFLVVVKVNPKLQSTSDLQYLADRLLTTLQL